MVRTDPTDSYLSFRAAIHVPPASQVNRRLRPTFPDRTTVNPNLMSARRRSSGLHKKHESLSALNGGVKSGRRMVRRTSGDKILDARRNKLDARYLPASHKVFPNG